MGIKIMHCADIHIGAKRNALQKSLKRRKEVLGTFLRAISFAKEKEVDLILISGDLFDSHSVEEDVLEEISSAFEGFSGRVFISPGNHDYYGANTFWEKWKLPQNVKVFKSANEVVEIPELNLKVFGGAFEGVYRKDHILSGFSADDRTINIAVIHGDLGADSVYGPISSEDIKNSKMDYIALGHIHKRTEVLKEGNTFYAYPGCPEGQGFDELYEKGVYFGEIEKGKVKMEFIPLCRRRFIEEAVDISSARSRGDVSKIILSQIHEKYGEEGNEWFYKIILKGETDMAFSSAQICADLEETLNFAKVKNKTKAPLGNLRELAKENSLRGIFVRKMLERESLGEDISGAVKLGLTAFSEEVIFDED